MVAFEGVTKTFGGADGKPGFAALAGIDYLVPKGSITGIIGRSGAGKSTLIRLANGLEKPSSGRVIVDGVDVAALDEKSLRTLRRSVGMIFQHFNLLSSRTAFDNVALPLEIAGLGKKEIETRVAPLLDLVGLSDKAKRYPAELSGGQKQRVGIARALATQPAAPVRRGDVGARPETTQSILELLKRINAELGLTVLLITHEMEVVKTIASQVAVIDRGLIVEQGRTFDIFTAPKHETTRSLLSSSVGVKLPHWVTSGLKPEAAEGDRVLVRLVFFGETAFQPLTARLVAEIGPDVNILAGTIEEISGEPFGSLVVSYPATAEITARASRFYTETGLHTEVLGYVA